ncbi:hypothetical protein RRG08_020740 [Elysia crispata]|uniref:Uncharacterized protein n=1 Tax=Elysia crispata TaxID=231223 RepID=A0AAE1E5A6_9GAST|nr:hypothetical protein RRG08_020740 [Elysia crispata]
MGDGLGGTSMQVIADGSWFGRYKHAGHCRWVMVWAVQACRSLQMGDSLGGTSMQVIADGKPNSTGPQGDRPLVLSRSVVLRARRAPGNKSCHSGQGRYDLTVNQRSGQNLAFMCLHNDHNTYTASDKPGRGVELRKRFRKMSTKLVKNVRKG